MTPTAQREAGGTGIGGVTSRSVKIATPSGVELVVLLLNRAAQLQLGGPSHVAIVSGATHLFEEPGTLERVAELARAWFGQHLGGREGRFGSMITPERPAIR